MGFTRTSEGRVFFKGPSDEETPRFEAARAAPPEPVLNVDHTQMQILLLLKSLNSKLKTSKEEQAAMKKQLAAYRASLKQVRDKTSAYETNYIDLEQQVARKQTEAHKQVTRVEDTLKDTLKQLEEARKIVEELESKADSDKETLSGLVSAIDERKKEEEKILKRQKDLEKQQLTQGEKMVDHVAAYVALTKRVSESESRQATLDNKIEENTSEFLKLDRKIDKAVEDRNRILRKIERIEAAVMETRDALNAKAMVLLTQQGAAAVETRAPSPAEYPPIASHNPDAALQMSMPEDEDAPWWQKTIRLNTASLAGLAFVVLALGWAISLLFSNGVVSSAPEELHKPEFNTQSLLEAPAQKDSSRAFSLKAENTLGDQALPPPDYVSLSERNKPEENQIDISDEKQTLAMMETAPEKVAETLNAIEPSSFTPPAAPQVDVVAEPSSIEKTVEKIDISPIPPARDEASYKSYLQSAMKPDPNLTEVAKRIEKQAFDGIPEAQHDMGAVYVAGHGPIKQDLKRAVFWFEEASKNGIANAQYNLGVLYHQGMGVEKNLDKAMDLYEKAAAQGHPEAQYNLGIANIEGIGVAYNPQKAAVYFENAANKNIMEAAYNLGLIYENGLLGETQPDQALMWYKTAADNGSPEAKAALEQIANSLGIALSDVNRVVEKTRASKKGVSALSADQQYITGEIQKELMERGLYPGPVDGMNGPMTANAIRTFQKDANIAADGIPSQDLLNIMRSGTN